MLKSRMGMLLSTLVLIICLPKIAHAGCNGYEDINRTCTGANGCSDQYTYTICSWGCVSGECVARGGSGLCCDHIYYNAEIYPDGGDCSGFCGEIRVRAGGPSAVRLHAEESWRGARLRQIDLGGRIYRVPRLLFVPDRCAQRYGIVVQEGGLLPAGGM
jgi:hypothetical protein